MAVRRTANTTLILLTSGALSACGTVRSGFEVSAPTAIPPALHGEIDERGRTTLRLDGIDLRVDVRNRLTQRKVFGWGIVPFLPGVVPFITSDTLGDPSRPLVIFFELHPREPGFSFEPMAIRIRRDRALRDLTPRGFVGPGRPSEQRCLDATGRELEEQAVSETFELAPDQHGTCFVLAFRAPSPTVIGFRLFLKGLLRGLDPIDLQEMRFQKRTGRATGPLGPHEDWVPAAFRPEADPR